MARKSELVNIAQSVNKVSIKHIMHLTRNLFFMLHHIPQAGGAQQIPQLQHMPTIAAQFKPQVAAQHGDIFIDQDFCDETFSNECQ